MGLLPQHPTASSTPSERSPLLPRKRHEEFHDGYSTASFASAVFSVSTTIVGAGIMGLPATMKTAGLVPGIILIVSVGLLTDFSIQMLLKFSDAGKAISYGGVMGDTCGRVGRILLQICVIINNFGVLVVYSIIIGDVLSGSTSSGVHHTGVLEEWAGGSTWWNGRVFVIFATTVLIFLPLSSFKHVDSLRLSSALSVALAVVFVTVTVGITIAKLFAGEINMPALFPHVDSQTSFLKLFAVVPVLVTAYICHHTVHPILNELEKASEKQNIIHASLVLCTAIYMATSVFGYLLFGDITMDDVLSNFDADLGVPYSNIFSDIVRVGYAVHLMLVFPLLHFSLRLNLDGLIFPSLPPLTTDTRRFAVITGFLITISFLVATFVPSIWDVFQFTGSTAAVCLGFIFPGVIVLRDVHGISTKRERCISWFMVVLAMVSSVIAITSDIYDLF
eukprot:c24339_g1_i1 orf=465-1808(-)